MKLHTHVWIGLLASLLPLAAQAYDGTASPIARTEGASQVVAVSSGVYHSCGLQADGGVRCWGDNTHGQAGYHADGPYLAVSSGGYHSCGLKSDGSVGCWGNNSAGQASVPVDAGPFVSVSAGGWHSCGLKADGSVRCWGANGGDYGQAGNHNEGPYVAISASWYHSCGLKADGSVHCWGFPPAGTDFGQAGDHADGPYLAVSTGVYHSCGLKMDGSVDCWGDNGYGQAADQPGPYVSVSAGYRHSCGLKVDGSVHCWGDNSVGQAGDHGDGPYVAISTGDYHSCGLKADGSVSCWGAGGPGTSGSPNLGQSTVPAGLATPGAVGFGQIATGSAHACDLESNGAIHCWGDNANGQTDAPEGLFTQVVAGNTRSCAIGTDGKATCWGQDGVDTTSLFGGGTWRQLAPSLGSGLCGIPVNNGAAAICQYPGVTAHSWQGGAWGFNFRNITNQDGQVCGVSLYSTFHGDGYCSSSGNTPIPGPFQRLEAGLDHQCGLKVDGGLQCWGSNADGQTDHVPTGTFRAFSVGWNHACAIKADGTLACWGSNLSGQTDAPAGTYVQVAAGNTFTCAIRSDGQRVCWGASPGNPASLGNLPDGTVGVAYSQQIAISGPNAPANPVFVQMSGTLPPGLSLSASGLLAGTPTTAGSFTFTIDAEGSSGFAATRTYAITIADSTPPSIGYVLTPPAPTGLNGWYVGDVGIDWTVADAESAITGSTGCNDTTLSNDTLGATYTCTATSAGGSNSVTTASIKRDATAPTLSPTVPSPLLRGGSYSASPNASDATSGVASSSCGMLDTSSLGTKSTTCSAADNAGNSKTVTLNYTVTTTCSNDGYSSTQLTWCRNICEMGYTGSTLNMWIRRWVDRYHNEPYCLAAPQQQVQ